MNTTSYSNSRRIIAFIIVLFSYGVAPVLSQNTDLPNPSPNIQTAPAGTLVIAMDNTLQANPGYFNVKAYGLIVKILNAEHPVRWVIQSGKAKDGVDFSAMASRVFPTTAAAAMRDFKSGPFLVFPQDTTGLAALIQSFNSAQSVNHRVNVYRLTAPVQVDVRYTLNQKPRGAVLNDGNNAKIHASYYIKAAIDSPMNWQVTTAADLVNQCYTFASEPHSNVTGPTIDSIRAYIMSGGNFLAQCQAITTFENFSSGRFHTTNGITTVNQSSSPHFAYPNADLSFSQYEGRFDPNAVGGAVKNWRKASASVFINDHHKHQTYALPSDTTLIGQAVAKLSSGRGHLVFYTGGHNYAKNNSIDQVNGMRTFFNAFLTPSGLTQCDFPGLATDIAVQASVNVGRVCLGDTTSFRIVVVNNGSAAAEPNAVSVRNEINATGLNVNSATATAGSYTIATGIWNVGTMLPGASDTLFLQVTATDSGLFRNTALVDKYFGDNDPSNDTSHVFLRVVLPQTVILPPVSACGSYTLPWGTVVNASGIYSNTIPSVDGCDSTQTVEVTITNSSPETCNGVDDDCNGLVDDGLTFLDYYADYDTDSYGAGSGVPFCSNPGAGYTLTAGDCDDGNAAINPVATEMCNGVDDDCDGQTDEGTLGSLGPISGTGVACVPLSGGTATFSVPLDEKFSGYLWTLPPGATAVSGQNTNTIIIGWSTSTMHNTGIIGTLSVAGVNLCGTGESSSIQLDLNFTVPVRPPSPSGPSRLCPGATATYSISTVQRTRSYFWTTPPGMVITSGQGTNIIQVAVGNTFAGGDLMVEARNSCGSGPLRIKNIGLNLAMTPDPISGPANGVCGATGVVYSTAGSMNSTSYLWTVPPGVTLISGQGGTSIHVDISNAFGAGSITVQGVNECGPGTARSLNIQGRPFIAGNISGSQSICPGAIGVPYGISTVSGATAYTWTAPGGSTVATGQGTKNILLNYGLTEATNQIIAVRASNNCGVSNAKTLSGITISSTFCGSRLGTGAAGQGVEFGIRPNPIRDLVAFDIVLDQPGELTLRISDAAGRLVFLEQLELPSGANTLHRDFSSLSSGIYAVTMIHAGGQSRQMIMVE